MNEGNLTGFVTRKALIHGIHTKGKEARADDVMRKDIPAVSVTMGLHDVQKLMHLHGTSAMPVQRGGGVVGVVTMDDINRVYVMISER